MIALHRIAVEIDVNKVVDVWTPVDAVFLSFERSDRYYIHFIAEDNAPSARNRTMFFAEASTRGIQPLPVMDSLDLSEVKYLGFAGQFHAWII